MSSALDEDTRNSLAAGRDTAAAMLRAAQKDLQKVFIFFLVGFLGTFYALRLYIWDFLKRVTRAQMSAQVSGDVSIIAQTPFDVILLQAKIGFVVGAGLDYDFADIDLGGPNASLEEVFRAKLRGGYKIGRGLLYGTGGYAWADTDNIGDDDGYFVGAGYEHLVTDNFSLGLEGLYHEIDDFGTGIGDDSLTTVQARGTFRF